MQFKARYLGIIIGPLATPEDSYAKPLQKLWNRVYEGCACNLSLTEKLRYWNSKVYPVLSFVDQFLQMPEEVAVEVIRALKFFIGGVDGWIHPVELGLLKTRRIYPIQARFPYGASASALLRNWWTSTSGAPRRRSCWGFLPSTWEDLCLMCPGADLLKHPGNTVINALDGLSKFRPWADLPRVVHWLVQEWYDKYLKDGVVRGLELGEAKKAISINDYVKDKLQKTICITYNRNAWHLGFHFGSHMTNIDFIMRVRIIKHFHVPPHGAKLIVDRWRRTMAYLQRLVPPKVLAANLRFILGGWPTKARCSSSGACPLCGLLRHDHIRHFTGCPIVKQYFEYNMNNLLPTFLLQFNHSEEDKDSAIMAAFSVLSIYNYTNWRRSSSSLSSPPSLQAVFVQQQFYTSCYKRATALHGERRRLSYG